MAGRSEGVVKRSISIHGHPTSVSLEDAFWDGLREIAEAEGCSVAALIARIDSERGAAGLSSSVRLFVLAHFRRRAMQHDFGREAGPDRAREGDRFSPNRR